MCKHTRAHSHTSTHARTPSPTLTPTLTSHKPKHAQTRAHASTSHKPKHAHTRAHAQKRAHTRPRTPCWSALTSIASMEGDHPAVATQRVATTEQLRGGAIVLAPPLISSTKRPWVALCRATQPATASGPVQCPVRAPAGRTARPQPSSLARCRQSYLSRFCGHYAAPRQRARTACRYMGQAPRDWSRTPVHRPRARLASPARSARERCKKAILPNSLRPGPAHRVSRAKMKNSKK